jgi:hypothetical protein
MTKARDLANGGFGLVLVKPSTVVNGTDNGKGTVSFSAQSSVSLNNVFSATYNNYHITANFTAKASGADFIGLRLRANGSDNSTSNYYSARSETTWAGTNGFYGQNGDSNLYMTYSENNGDSFNFECYVAKPFLADVTNFFNRAIRYQSGGKTQWLNGSMVVANSFDGFTLFCGGTMTGKVSVYGYNN